MFVKKKVKRWSNGTNYKKCIVFYKAICKYSWNHIIHEILFTGLTKKEAEQKEIEIIAAYNSTDSQKGYNATNGGNHNGTMTDAFKKKSSEIKKANKNPMYGKHAYNKGVPMTNEQKQKKKKTNK